MKVIFLDFDGVLNSAASFLLEDRIRKENKIFDDLPPINQTLCKVCTSNFRHILDEVPDARIVLSTTWRNLFEMEWLKEKLFEYGIPKDRVIDKTPDLRRAERGEEIDAWLKKHPEVTKYVILDDNYIGPPFQGPLEVEGSETFIKTHWNIGLTLQKATEAVKVLGGKNRSVKLGLE